MLKSPNTVVGLLFPLQFYQVCLKNYAALLFGAYTFGIAVSSWWPDPFIIVHYLSLSLVIFFALTSPLTDMNIALIAPFD